MNLYFIHLISKIERRESTRNERLPNRKKEGVSFTCDEGNQWSRNGTIKQHWYHTSDSTFLLLENQNEIWIYRNIKENIFGISISYLGRTSSAYNYLLASFSETLFPMRKKNFMLRFIIDLMYDKIQS